MRTGPFSKTSCCLRSLRTKRHRRRAAGRFWPSTSAAPLISPTFVPRAGQRQIACLARAVVNRPVLILADEPATHLDKANAQTLINLLGAFALAGVTVVAATHQHLTPEGCRSREITLSASNRGGAA